MIKSNMAPWSISAVDPLRAGFRPQSLDELDAFLDRDVSEGTIAGCVVLLARRGHVGKLTAYGRQCAGSGRPMRLDSIFRIASMTKPIVTVATLALMEQGKLSLSDPVSHYLPEMAGLTVAEGSGSVPALRGPTIHDLLRHTAGFTTAMLGNSPSQARYHAADVRNPRQTNEQLAAKLASVPLRFQPGTTFEYGMSTDVLGRVLEVVTGEDLDTLMHRLVTGPLGMTSTGFHLVDQDRLAEPLDDPKTGRPLDLGLDLGNRHRWLGAGGGMLSTAADYLLFLQMMLNKGSLGDKRILSRHSIDLMLAGALPPATQFGPDTRAMGVTAPIAEFGQTFGLGVAIRQVPGLHFVPGSVGDFHWAGIHGSYFWCDPNEELICIFMLQEPSVRMRYRSLLRGFVYGALR